MAGWLPNGVSAVEFVNARAKRNGTSVELTAWDLYQTCSDPETRQAFANIYIRASDERVIRQASTLMMD